MREPIVAGLRGILGGRDWWGCHGILRPGRKPVQGFASGTLVPCSGRQDRDAVAPKMHIWHCDSHASSSTTGA